MKNISKEIKQDPDSITIGSSKTGIVKCYGDYSKPEAFTKKIDNAALVLAYARKKLQEETKNEHLNNK